MSIREVNRVLAEYAKQKLDPKSQAATRWLATNLSKIESQMRPDVFNRSRKASSKPASFSLGCMMFFGYDPKGRAELPFWDEFPLIIVLKKSGSSLLGLNLHYLRPADRATFLNYLLRFVDNPDYHRDPPSYLNVTYEQLKRNRYMRQCIKRYNLSNIKTKVNIIPSDEWKIITFLPIDRFKGASKQQAWRESR